MAVTYNDPKTVEINFAEIKQQVSGYLAKVRIKTNGENLPQPIMVQLKWKGEDILTWLQAQRKLPKIYWQGRDDGLEIGGVGAALTLSENDPERVGEKYRFIRNILENVPGSSCLRFFGGAGFNNNVHPQKPWQDFPGFWYVLPEMMLCRQRMDVFLVLTLVIDAEKSIDELTEQLLRKIEGMNSGPDDLPALPIPSLLKRHDYPNIHGWQQNVLKSLSLIHSGSLQKVVLARQTTLDFSVRLDWAGILSRLKEQNKNCFIFLFQPKEGKVFLGVTPERLFRIDHNLLISEAVSGTIPRGADDLDDDRLGLDLLHSDKNLREHRFVAESIKKMFDELCDNTGAQPNPRLLKLSNVQHLYSKISGYLKKEISLFDVIAKMHSTPAVGGTPRDAAVALIEELEPFDRGWYAGQVGFISRDTGEMVVALRSMLLDESRIHLFAGAGIVSGSEPDLEWQELESKISIPLQIFAGEKN
ncbi:MAG TPA: isochorismate synthase [Bacteroidetes bacterium]|nr:isochorismate synthase [Bacteroidota bacterium]